MTLKGIAEDDFEADPTKVDPVAAPAHIEITLLRKSDGPLTKTIHRDANGAHSSDSRNCRLVAGDATRLRLQDAPHLAKVLNNLDRRSAIILGAMRENVGSCAKIVTKKMRADFPDAITRTQDYFEHRAGTRTRPL